MLVLKPKEYAEMLMNCYLAKQPLFVSGGPGIGKSAIPRQIFAKLAAEKKLEFCEWSDLTLEEKKACIATPEKFFVFCDQRTSQMDTTSLMGIPNMANKELLENIPYSWVVYFTQENANGVIFFDEINLAAPIVQSITYSAINDRVISDRRLGDNVYVFAAGNRQQDKAHTFDMPLPLRDRFAEFEVTHDADCWVDWAISAKINPHLINFISWKSSYLYKVDVGKNDKPSTPRGIARASNLIGNKKITSDQVHTLVAISAGEAFATEFQAYTKVYSKLDWEKLFKNPALVAELELSQCYAVAGGIVERYQKDPKDLKMLEQLFSLVEHLRADFTLNTLRMMRDTDRTEFSNGLRKLKKGAEYAQKYGKYMVDISE